MARWHFGARETCESIASIDLRDLHREGRLSAGQYFSWSLTCGGVPSGTINVRTEEDAVVLLYRARSLLATEWKAMEQRVPITWTNCHLGGRRPWFICPVHRNGRYCGQRVAVLYAAGELFACRRCYDLAYASQQEKPVFRNLRKSQKIRIRLGGSPDPFEPFPEKPRRMHRRTYLRLREEAEAAEAFVKELMARAVLYAAGELFACRRCYDLAYASQQEKPVFRNLRKSQKIRIRLGGSPVAALKIRTYARRALASR